MSKKNGHAGKTANGNSNSNPAKVHTRNTLAAKAKDEERNPFTSIRLNVPLTLNPDALAMVLALAEKLGCTANKALADLLETHLIQDVRNWEKNAPEEYAAEQERFWAAVQKWYSTHRKSPAKGCKRPGAGKIGA